MLGAVKISVAQNNKSLFLVLVTLFLGVAELGGASSSHSRTLCASFFNARLPDIIQEVHKERERTEDLERYCQRPDTLLPPGTFHWSDYQEARKHGLALVPGRRGKSCVSMGTGLLCDKNSNQLHPLLCGRQGLQAPVSIGDNLGTRGRKSPYQLGKDSTVHTLLLANTLCVIFSCFLMYQL